MIGKTIAHYRILGKLGAGGMGEVFKAEDTKLKRTVALKFLPPDLERNEEARQRFVHEAQAASALDHPNICSIHEIGEHEGRTFIVMGYYEGETLKERIADSRFQIDEAIDVVLQVASGLSKAHEAGIVHRDIKPANIALTRDGTAKILDFGLAKVSGQTLLTKAGSTLGTAAYMSPEQARSEDVDVRTDVWSLGVVLYEMLAGKRPFESDYEQALVYSILNEDPKPLREYRPDIPEDIEKICRRAMAKNPKDRYQTASELIADLEAYASGSSLSHTTRRVLTNRRKVIYSVSAAAVVIAGIVALITSQASGEVFERVAVLPVRNISKDSTGEILADGVTEQLIARLEQVAQLNVRSIRSSMKYKGSQASYMDIARELEVQALIDASIQSVNNRMQIVVRLIDPATDRSLWSQTYDGNIEDILDLQNSIALAVVTQVRVNVSRDEQERLRRAEKKVNPQAYELYLQARHDTFRFLSHPSKPLWDSLMAKLQKAIDIEPDNARYYAALAGGYFNANASLIVPFREAIPKAKAAADAALRYDPDLAESQSIAGVVAVHEYDFDTALIRRSRAMQLSPGNTRIHHGYADLLRTLGRFDESLATYRRIQELDPSEWAETGFLLGFTYYMMRRYDDAIAFLKEWLRTNPHHDLGLTFLAFSYSMKGMHAEALASNDSARYWGPMNRPYILYRAGQIELASKAYKEGPPQNDYGKAIWCMYTGQKDSAFYWLHRFYLEPTGELTWVPHDAWLDGLRDDPRFDELLRKMNLLR